MTSSEPELKVLMLRALDGDAGAYRQLLAGLQPRLEAYFRGRLRADPTQAEDLTQEALIALHTRRATFDRAQPLLPWVFAIARYKLIDHYRRSGRRIFVPLDDGLELAAPDAQGPAEARHDLARGLAALSPRTADMVVRVKLEEEPVADVARRTGLSQGAVKVAVHRGFRRLAARLRGEAGE